MSHRCRLLAYLDLERNLPSAIEQLYLEDFLPLELDDASRGIGDNDFGGAADERFLWFDNDEADAGALLEAAVVEVGPSSTLEMSLEAEVNRTRLGKFQPAVVKTSINLVTTNTHWL